MLLGPMGTKCAECASIEPHNVHLEDLKIANLATFATSTLSDATYLRVHDVQLTKDTVQVINKAQSLI